MSNIFGNFLLMYSWKELGLGTMQGRLQVARERTGVQYNNARMTGITV